MLHVLERLLWEEQGQDLVEYALLTAGIGVVGVATWPLIAVSIGNTYAALDADTQEIWEVPNPGAGM